MPSAVITYPCIFPSDKSKVLGLLSDVRGLGGRSGTAIWQNSWWLDIGLAGGWWLVAGCQSAWWLNVRLAGGLIS